MKGLSLMILALALVFRAAPICAAPPEAPHVIMAANCENMADQGAPESDHDKGKAAQICHACAFAVSEQPSSLGAWFWKAPAVLVPSQRQMAGTMRKPPTPPPRLGSASTFQHFNINIGVKS